DINNLDYVRLNLNPDIIISSLTLHHLNMREKIKIINGMKNIFNTKILLSEVDFNLETINDIKLRNVSINFLLLLFYRVVT
ncbi:MAG: hypothetical protein N3B13_08935, partial [Deltaproteobacteria bacterium]|nr:hypothetical protein [Deltaproteobacteria bacterium]